MKVLLFGATGMIGQGVLRECLAAPDVTAVRAVGRRAQPEPSGARRPSRVTHPKLTELVANDLFDLSPHAAALTGYDACFFCLGVSSAGMSEADYRRITRDLTLAVAEVVVRQNPGLTFVYVSGAGTDATEHGRTMWARVKGETENALRRAGFARLYLFRPGFIQPLHGIRSRTPLYRAVYAVAAPLFPVLNALFPDQLTTTERIGRAMLAAVRRGPVEPVVDAKGINALARGE